MTHQNSVRTQTSLPFNFRFGRSHLVICFMALLAAGCASPPPELKDVDPTLRENAVFACKQEIQSQKKARFARLPPLVKRIAGDHQIMREFDSMPTMRKVWGAIGRLPLEGDSGGAWRMRKEAQLRTVSVRIEKPLPTDENPEGLEMLSLSFGQPGRIYSIPVSSLKRHVFDKKFGMGLSAKYGPDTLQIRPVDQHHVLIVGTTAPSGKSDKDKQDSEVKSNFYFRSIFAIVRTYVEQTYMEESATQLSDYPIYEATMSDENCESLTGAPQ